MPFDGNGNWTSNYNAEADRDAGYKILASRFDNILLADLARSFENCLTKDTQIKPQTNFNANNYRVINVADPIAEKDAVNKETLDSSINNLVSALYPVGSIYIGTQKTCPLSTLIPGSTWQIVATNRALWGGDGSNANTTIEAGLPNITGSFSPGQRNGAIEATGAFYGVQSNKAEYSSDANGCYYNFDASRSNSIYGNSTTVQPPSYRVNVWRRTA